MKRRIKKTKKFYSSIEEMFKELHKNDKYWWYQIYLFFYRLWFKIINFPGDLKRKIYFFFQRGIRGYAEEDIWGFDYYLSKIIAGGTKYLKTNCHALPTWKEGKTELECKNEWDCILNTIIQTFETTKAICEGDIYYLPTVTWSDKDYKRCKQLAKESKYPYKVLSRKEAKEFERGFDYFKKYFFSLWD